jgi:ribosomal protein L37AE/L43A
MTQHFTRSTVSAEAFCPKCRKQTQHRVDDRRISACLECVAKLETAHQLRKVEAPKQGDLFR